MVVRNREHQFIIRLNTNEIGTIDNFCGSNGITRSEMVYDLITRIDKGEYKW